MVQFMLERIETKYTSRRKIVVKDLHCRLDQPTKTHIEIDNWSRNSEALGQLKQNHYNKRFKIRKLILNTQRTD